MYPVNTYSEDDPFLIIVYFGRYNGGYALYVSTNYLSYLNEEVTEEIGSYTFVYPNKDNFAINIDNEFIDKFRIRNSGSLLIYYFKNKKILISRDDNYFYLINFNVAIPEVFQKVETDSKLANYNNDYNYSFYNYFQHKINNFIEILNCSNEDSIYISYSERKFENYLEHDITYFVQYSIIDNELKEISRIELKNEIIIIE